ncbi:hypothetical protein [Paenibacillus sp. 1-18]|uniref:hypothetical protein n=1 Tax=Paenibacillus sp. 1-18 TaxID=1333846 RepID=UPI0004AD700A|nr:hypothetical protein [Paenibacillus sp. 1-18]
MYPDGGIARMKYDATGNMSKMILPEHYDPIHVAGTKYEGQDLFETVRDTKT